MSEIRPPLPSIAERARDSRKSDEEVADLIKSIAKDRTKATELRRMDLAELSPANRSHLSQALAEALRGQLPPNLAAALNRGDADPALLSQLTGRLANAASGNPNDRAGVAGSIDAAREQAANPNLPQQAVQWSRFVQTPTGVGGGGLQGRHGSASPKGEGTILAEMIASKLAGGTGPGLRNPKLVERAVKDMSPQQRAALMDAVFGRELASILRGVGISDPIMFVKAGALPQDRAQLSLALNIPRSRLLGLLMRAELLKIGGGRNGELAIRPEFLGPLKDAGIAMLGTLAALRGLSFDELKWIYQKLRERAGGFANAVKGGRIPVKRDLLHWAKTAARKKSDILLADSEEYYKHGGAMKRDDAMELIQAWYLENLLWDSLAEQRRRGALEQRRREEEQERQRRQDQQNQEEEQQQGDWTEDDIVPDLEFDEARDDKLMCFWITDYDDNPQNPGQRRMYVCVDPETGAIIPQYIEKEEPKSM